MAQYEHPYLDLGEKIPHQMMSSDFEILSF